MTKRLSRDEWLRLRKTLHDETTYVVEISLANRTAVKVLAKAEREMKEVERLFRDGEWWPSVVAARKMIEAATALADEEASGNDAENYRRMLNRILPDVKAITERRALVERIALALRPMREERARHEILTATGRRQSS